MHNDFIWMFLFKNWNSFRFLNKRGLFKRASEVWKKNQKALLTQRHLKHFCKKTCHLDGLFISFYLYFPQIVLDINTYFFFFRTRNFMNKKLRNVSLCKKQLPICHLSTPQKTTHKHVAFTVFLYRQKVSSSPESYSPKMGFSRIL